MTSFAILLAASLYAQAGLEPPAIGYFRDRQQALRPLMGVRGAFVAGEPIASGVSAFAWDGKRLIAVHNGTWREWRDRAWHDLPLPALESEPVAIQIVRRELWAVIRRGASFFLLRCRPDSKAPQILESELSGVAAPLLITGGGDFLHHPDWCASDLEWMGDEWIHARKGAADVAIHHASGEAYDLPQTEQSP
jgi:hypothetical protein